MMDEVLDAFSILIIRAFLISALAVVVVTSPLWVPIGVIIWAHDRAKDRELV